MTESEKEAVTSFVRRNVRPNFADDVYGPTASKSNATEEVEICESALAQRRSAHLPKLKEISTKVQQSVEDPSPYTRNMDDLDFTYSDCDSHGAELSKLYSYSEMEDWATNVHLFRSYARNKELRPFWCSFTEAQKKSVVHDLISRLDSAQPDGRLEAARMVLYIMQGAYLDYVPDMENFDDNFEIADHFAAAEGGVPSFEDVGSGGHEKDLLDAGVKNAFFMYRMGVYQALCTMLMVEIEDPFDVKSAADPNTSRTSSAANSRSASNADLSECKKSVTIADNEALRVVLSCLYHMVESIRRTDLIADDATDKDGFKKLREQFIQELEAPLDSAGVPLIIVLFQMLPSFLHGSTPHFPMKKVLLLIWKCLLGVLGGWEELRKAKAARRKECELKPIEDTLEVAGQLRAITIGINDGIESAVSNAKTRIVHGPRLISRQLACTSTDGNIRPDDDEITELSDAKDSKLRLRTSSEDDNDEEGGNSRNDENPDLEDTDLEQLTENASRRLRLYTTSTTDSSSTSGDQTPKARTPPPFQPAKKNKLPWTPKVREEDIANFLESAREKFLKYRLPGDTTTLFGLPPPVLHSITALRRNIYTSLGDIQIKNEKIYNRFIFSRKEVVEVTKTERLYRQLLPNMCEYIVAILKMLLAALPSSKAKADAINILSDVLTPETDNIDILSNSMSMDTSIRNILEVGVRVSIDVGRHKEIIIESSSAILILLMKFFRLNHIYQYENFSRHLLFANCIPLILKFLDQNMCRYVQAKNELTPFNFPHAPLHYVRNHDQWPVLDVNNVDDSEVDSHKYFVWRNVFATINLLRVLNKLTKWKHVRTMMLVVFKSAPILKRALRVKLGTLQLYVLKLLKMQARYLGRQWRRTNMEVISAIYNKVRHRLNDDWAYANETRSKSWDFQLEEKTLKYAIERFNARRYSHLYPNFALGSDDIAPDDFVVADDGYYLEKIDMKDFEHVDNCLQSVLGVNHELSDRFKQNYEQWVDSEVIRHQIDWDNLLMSVSFMFRLISRSHALSAVTSRCFVTQSTGTQARQPLQQIDGVKKTSDSSPFDETALAAYNRVHFDDTVTRDDPEVQRLKRDILAGSRAALAAGITLVESKNPSKRARGNYLLSEIMSEERKRYLKDGPDSLIFRIGISGSPGVGKSSFIEALGHELTVNQGKKVAVLTVDPSSATTGGSLLGDLTRMQNLSRNPMAYIRQSPTSGSLGGVTRGIHESIILCEGAGYDVVLIETVGVGQSEVSVNDMCDMFCLLLSPAHGDELQGVKRGIMEQSDLLVVTKSDGELEPRAKLTAAEYISALKFMRPKSEFWKPKVLRASIYKPESITNVCETMYKFWNKSAATGHLISKRNMQMTTWMWNHVRDEIMNLFQRHPMIMSKAPQLEKKVRRGEITPGFAAESLLRTFFGLK